MKFQPTRRELLWKCAGMGVLTLASPMSWADAIAAIDRRLQAARATPWVEVGPFYKRGAPTVTELRRPSDPGLPLAVSGKVFSVDGSALPGARLEIWQADNAGHYDLAGYRFRTTLVTDTAGDYGFHSIMPGHYPTRVCQHVHYMISAPGHRALSTQLYFSTDPVFDGDPQHNYSRDPLITSVELVRPVRLAGDPQAIEARVDFPIVLEKL